MWYFFQYSFIDYRALDNSKEQHLFAMLKYIIINIINVFTVTFDQFNVSSSLNKNLTDPKPLNSTVC